MQATNPVHEEDLPLVGVLVILKERMQKDNETRALKDMDSFSPSLQRWLPEGKLQQDNSPFNYLVSLSDSPDLPLWPAIRIEALCLINDEVVETHNRDELLRGIRTFKLSSGDTREVLKVHSYAIRRKDYQASSWWSRQRHTIIPRALGMTVPFFFTPQGAFLWYQSYVNTAVAESAAYAKLRFDVWLCTHSIRWLTDGYFSCSHWLGTNYQAIQYQYIIKKVKPYKTMVLSKFNKPCKTVVLNKLQ